MLNILKAAVVHLVIWGKHIVKNVLQRIHQNILFDWPIIISYTNITYYFTTKTQKEHIKCEHVYFFKHQKGYYKSVLTGF